jgi:hypothetical protein
MIPQVQDFAPATPAAARPATSDPQRWADPRPPSAFQEELDRRHPRGPAPADVDRPAQDAVPSGGMAAPAATATPAAVPRHAAVDGAARGDAAPIADARTGDAQIADAQIADAQTAYTQTGAVPTDGVSAARLAGETMGDPGGPAPGAGLPSYGGATGAAIPVGGANAPLAASGRLVAGAQDIRLPATGASQAVPPGAVPPGAVSPGAALAPPPVADGGAGAASGAQGTAAGIPHAGGEDAARVPVPLGANGAPLAQATAAGGAPNLRLPTGADAPAQSPSARRDRGDAALSARAAPAPGVSPQPAPALHAAMIRPDAAPLAGTSGGATPLPDPVLSGEPGVARTQDAAAGGFTATGPVGHGAPPPPHIASAADMPGVSRQILAALAQSPGGAVDVTLSPDELGRVRLSLSTTDLGGIVVNVIADRPETMDLIRRHLDMLAQDFRDIGYGSVSFGFSDHSGGHDGDAPWARAGGTVGPAALSVIPEIALVPATGTGLDLRL